MIRLLIVEENHLMGSVLAAALARQPDLCVAGFSASRSEALARVRGADVALVRMGASRLRALDVIHQLSVANPELKVVAVGVPDSEEVILQCIEAGATGYVQQHASLDSLVSSIHAAHTGQALVSRDMAAVLMAHYARLAELSHAPKLLPSR